MRHKACVVWVDFHPQLRNNIRQFRSSNNYVKKQITQFIFDLLDDGYRHFIIFIECPSDLWVAEIIYFLKLSSRNAGIIYSIGLWSYDEDPSLWLLDSPFFYREILENANKVFWRKKKWYDNNYRLKRIYIPQKEN